MRSFSLLTTLCSKCQMRWLCAQVMLINLRVSENLIFWSNGHHILLYEPEKLWMWTVTDLFSFQQSPIKNIMDTGLCSADNSFSSYSWLLQSAAQKGMWKKKKKDAYPWLTLKLIIINFFMLPLHHFALLFSSTIFLAWPHSSILS